MSDLKKIMIVVPSLKAGGMERVAAVLANTLSKQIGIKVYLFSLSDIEPFFVLNHEVIFLKSSVKSGENFFSQVYRSFRSLRKAIKHFKPNTLLSFGDRYNSLSIAATIGLSIPVYISNRQNPFLSNGKIIDILNWIFYRFASGMIAQTKVAEKEFIRKYRHNNIQTIGNPFELPNIKSDLLKKRILYVGRFSDQKNQFELIDIFDKCETDGWELIFVGDGAKKGETIKRLEKSHKKDKIKVIDFDNEIEKYYLSASIFAFTSRSEGFPNALGEAMSYGLPVISYNCIAGPSDLIDNEVNGLLIEVGNHAVFREKLQQLMDDFDYRNKIGKNASKKMTQFDTESISKKYLHFILAN